VAEGEWSGFSKMHDRYLYRPSSFSKAEKDQGVDSERLDEGRPHNPKDKRTQPAAGSNVSGKLPLDL